MFKFTKALHRRPRTRRSLRPPEPQPRMSWY